MVTFRWFLEILSPSIGGVMFSEFNAALQSASSKRPGFEKPEKPEKAAPRLVHFMTIIQSISKVYGGFMTIIQSIWRFPKMVS
jgi:hypothetical protein